MPFEKHMSYTVQSRMLRPRVPQLHLLHLEWSQLVNGQYRISHHHHHRHHPRLVVCYSIVVTHFVGGSSTLNPLNFPQMPGFNMFQPPSRLKNAFNHLIIIKITVFGNPIAAPEKIEH